MSIRGCDITVIGGGIGGLAAALALRQRGAEVTVLEQAEAIAEVGAGIQVSPNGMRVLEALGLDTTLKKRSVRGRAVSLRNGVTGLEVARLDLTRLDGRQSYHFVHRADIVDLLAEAARGAGVHIRLLQKVRSVSPGARPRMELCNGDHRESDLVIGADGLNSVMRPALNGAAEPFFTGQVAWRCIVPNVTGQPAQARVHMGPGRHLVSYPLRDGSMVNIVAVEERGAWIPESWSQRDDADNLRAAFANFCPEVHHLLGAAEQPGLWGLFRHPVAGQWWAEGAALLGDAAHPTLPFLAQGANMALEDAWVLADALETEPDRDQALQRYQERRIARVRRVIDAANGNAWRYHLRPGPLRFAAHAGLGLLSRLAPGRMLAQFDWLYGHDVTQGTAA